MSETLRQRRSRADAIGMPRLPLRAAARVLAVAAVLAAAAAAAPSSAQTGSPTRAVSAVDDLGRTVTLARPARRIISMAPHATELLFAAGAAVGTPAVPASASAPAAGTAPAAPTAANVAGPQVVAVDRYSDMPASARTLPNIGDNFRLDTERILSLRPDLIVVWKGGSSARQVEQLGRLGIPLFFSGVQRVGRIPDDIDALGKLMGTDAVAGAAAARLRQRLQDLSARYAARPPVTVFYQVWDQPLYTLNGSQIVSDALRLCGGVNIFADLAATAPVVSTEAVLARDPEAIIGTAENSPNGGVYLWRAYPALRAVRHHNLMTVDGNLMNRAGPRMLDGVAQLCERLEAARGRRRLR